MILTCQSCQARYLVPAVHFATGPRTVRCGRCGHMWEAELPPEPAAALVEQLSALSPPTGEMATGAAAAGKTLPIVHGGSKAFWKSDWFLSLLALLIAACMLFLAVDRKSIALHYPWTEPYYDRVGLHIYHAGEGLSLRQVHSESRFEGGIMQLGVEGEVHNDTDKLQPIPNILAAAIGPDDKIMQSWQIDAPAATVAPGESVPFSSAIRAPDGTVVEVSLHFIEPNNGN